MNGKRASDISSYKELRFISEEMMIVRLQSLHWDSAPCRLIKYRSHVSEGYHLILA